MTKPLIVGNWKMNTLCDEAVTLANDITNIAQSLASQVDIGICPPFPWIVPVANAAAGSPIRIGAQDCAATSDGAYTGDVSATMLATCCSFTLVGHSERRQHHHESDDIVRRKLDQALIAGLDVILCVGESGQDRTDGIADNIVRRQLGSALDGVSHDQLANIAIAYEPVWAIGTGTAATADDAADMATTIRQDLESRSGSAASIRILYGGSANDSNAASFLAASNVNGLLVGGASLSAERFGAMLRQAATA